MRRTAVWPVLVLTFAVLSGNGTAAAQEPLPEVIHPPMPVPEMPVPPEYRPLPGPPAPLVAAPPVELPTPFAPAPAASFAGRGDAICSLALGCTIPPDIHGAAGPNHLMEVLNTEVWVQDPTTGAPLSGPFLLDDWWGAGVNPNLDGAFDPRVHYDPYADRWISVVCDENPATDFTQSALLFGVSTTGDPTGVWNKTRIDADPANLVWADYPNIGFNNRWVVVQVNLFTGAGAFDSSRILVYDKTTLYAGSFATVADWRLTVAHGGTQVPSATYDATEPDLHLLQRWNGDVGGVGYLRLYTLTGPTGAPVLAGEDPSPPMFVTTGAGEGWEGSATGTPSPDFAPQTQDAGTSNCTNALCGGNCKIQTNDDRIQNLVQRNGKLWTTQSVFLPLGGPGRSSVRWWQIDPVTTGVDQKGLVDDPSGFRFFAFPSIAVNKHQDVLLGYSSFEDSQYASASYSFRTFFDAPGTMQSELVTKAGDACYYKNFSAPSRNRWGDYSATIVDADDSRLWTLQEYAAPHDSGEPFQGYSDKWGSWWSMLDTTRTISIDDVAMNEGDSGATAFVFTVTLNAPTPLTVTVGWDTADGSATIADGDYVQVTGGLVTFAPGETSKTVQVDVIGDIKWETDENFFVDLSNPVNADFGDPQGEGTITNDDSLPQASVSDVQLIEGNGGFQATPFTFKITLSNPSSMPVDIDWATAPSAPVSATPGPANDYTTTAGMANFVPGDVEEDVVVPVHGDVAPEPDERFDVDLIGNSGATLLKTKGVGWILDDDAFNPGVEALGAVAGGGPGAGSGTTLLQWYTPPGAAGAFIIEANQSIVANGTCVPPGPLPGGGDVRPRSSPAGHAGNDAVFHCPDSPPLNPDFEYCYSVWVNYPPVSAVASVNARPYDSTGKLKWKYFSGASLLAQPTVGPVAIVAPANDMLLHAMARGAGGGPWPAPWLPVHLGAVSQHRAPIVPVGGVSRAYIATQDGRVHCIDTLNGMPLWSSQLPEGAALAAPAGMFTAFGGAFDYLVVGTSSGSGNRLYALDPFTGAVIDAFPQPGDGIAGTVGAINSMASIDYANNSVYFTSWQGTSNGTVWALNLGPPSDALSLAWRFDGPSNVNGSPVLHNGRVYLGDANDRVWSHDAVFGDLDQYVLPLGDGEPRGFLFPDRRNDKLYVATNTTVWAIQETGAALVPFWPSPGLVAPSVVLHHPGTDDIYVGVQNHLGTAAVIKLDATDGSIVSYVPLENGPSTIGPPSLDIGSSPNMLHVGSVAGILYGVELPF